MPGLSSYKSRLTALFLCSLSSFANVSHALPFTIVPASPLPVMVLPGETTTAFYTVTNNTGQARSGNFVKWLPPNVSILNAQGLCGNAFDLGPAGSANASCTLGLTISGPVNANDPDPHHHLFVCFPGGITCAGTNYPLNVSGSGSPPTFTTIGFASNFGGVNRIPLGYTSINGGQDWALSSPFQLPAGQDQGGLVGISCRGSLCTAVGVSLKADFSNLLPLVYTSTDGGRTWALSPPLPLPVSSTDTELECISCTGNVCVSIGTLFNPDSQPISYISNDGGTTWTFTGILSLPAGETEGFVDSVACIGSTCTAVGGTGTNLPMAYISYNSGHTWILSNPLDLPAGQTSGVLFDVSCTGTHCTAVGESFKPGFTNVRPLVYISNDSGVHWTLSAPLTIPVGQNGGGTAGVSCIGSICTAVGFSFIDFFTNELPLAYTSTDGGASWTLSEPLPATLGELLDVNCLASHCVAVGETVSGQPLSYNSNDSGISWTLSSAFSLPGGKTQGSLNGVAGG